MKNILFSLHKIVLDTRLYLLNLSLALRLEIFIYILDPMDQFHQFLEIAVTDVGGISALS
jgi:hypothetical protein